MDARLKASCWCCEACISARHQKLHQHADCHEVFLPPTTTTTGSVTNHIGNGMKEEGANHVHQSSRPCLDSGIGGVTSESEGHNSDVNYDSATLLSDSDWLNSDRLLGSLAGCYDLSPFDHLYQVLNCHPQYFTSFLETHNFLMRGIGPLPYDQRCYIGILAAARHHCSYLVKSLASYFLACGGEEKWLAGLEYIPKKLRNLCEVNRILAHRPWLLTKEHIQKLTKGADNWSLSELTQALILLSHFHSLSSFVFACGIALEADKKRLHLSSSSNSDRGSFDDSSSDSDVEIDLIMERMKLLSAEAANEVSQEELRKRFDKLETQATQLTTRKKQTKNLDLLRFIEDPDFTFEDFAKRDPSLEIQTFDIQGNAWEDLGYSLTSWLYPEVATLLDNKFQVAQDMTYYKMGHKQNVDTFTFRRATWNYIHCLFGMFHDDYDYNEIDHLVEKNLKWYIKAATCTPETIVYKNYCSFMKEFLDSEKVHINVMVLEARLQAELLYCLRAVSRHMT